MADVFPPLEPIVVAYLQDAFAELDETAEVGVGVPANWKPGSVPWVQVASDGTPRLSWPVAAHTTIRLVARAGSTTEAQRLASLAQGLLAAHPGSGRDEGDIARVRVLTGVMPVRDTDTRAELAWTTCQVTQRSQRVA